MYADEAKYLLSVSDVESQNFEVTSFAGVDAISNPYWFDVEFRMSGAAKAANISPLTSAVLDEACRFDSTASTSRRNAARRWCWPT